MYADARSRDLDDAWHLDRAAEALKRQSKRPRSLVLAVVCRLLTETAENIRDRRH